MRLGRGAPDCGRVSRQRGRGRGRGRGRRANRWQLGFTYLHLCGSTTVPSGEGLREPWGGSGGQRVLGVVGALYRSTDSLVLCSCMDGRKNGAVGMIRYCKVVSKGR